MAITSAADAFLIFEFIIGHRPVPNSVFASLLVSLSSVSPHSSQRLRTALALRALDAALSDCVDAPALLHKAMAILTNPHIATYFPQRLSAPATADNTPAAAVANLKRLLDVAWASLPPSTLEIAADLIAGAGALHTWENADHALRSKLRLLVGESTEREILGKLKQYASTNHPVMVPEVDNAPQTHVDITQHQQESIQGAPNAQFKERLVTRTTVRGKDCDITEKIEDTTPHVTGEKNHQVMGSKRNLMEMNPTASTYEWGDGLGDCDAERSATKRRLPIFQNKTNPSPTAAKKTRKTWSEIQEKTLLEGVKKYGKGNWKDIKMAYPDVFANRSTVDLKDKFRNMERNISSSSRRRVVCGRIIPPGAGVVPAAASSVYCALLREGRAPAGHRHRRGLIRIFFHDCFPQGCDASVYLKGPNSEQDMGPNKSLQQRALQLVENIRAKVHAACGPTVSCTDISALATRAAVVLSRGPRYLGPGSACRPGGAVGGHTIGRSQCDFIRTPPDDTFSQNMAANCSTNPSRLQDLDVITPNEFDNAYYKALVRNRGVFTSDMALIRDPTTAPIVRRFARNQDAFFAQFADSMFKLSLVPRPRGNIGEIRRNCFRRNDGAPHLAANTTGGSFVASA
ncbi:hypothetical protein GUJ93_ZPchr0458g22431 [Zizania palustris]|uniref:Peroxidase n=1 Tax=Zizania palustris TaxID=103762 RepID=A0A8J5V2U8_ZIZPA|nr:hypothetical protein GUJ93_ZPchr0458g22431 [Zizania palustris]